MTTAVQITLIICATIVAIFLISNGKNNKNDKDRKDEE